MMQFQNHSGFMRLTDPQYPRGTWCATSLPVRTGEWVASHRMEFGRISSLRVEHVSCNQEPYQLIPLDFGVDTGQFGFYDDANYPVNNQEFEYDNIGGFYRRVCDRFGNVDIIKNEMGDAFGVTSSTGFGDGSYPVYGTLDGDEYVAFEIRFMEDEVEWEEEEWMENWEEEEETEDV